MKRLALFIFLLCLGSCKAGREIENLNFGPGPQDEYSEQEFIDN